MEEEVPALSVKVEMHTIKGYSVCTCLCAFVQFNPGIFAFLVSPPAR